jgi:uncharacterized membrane protein|tara:strand:+ start:312 stop:824 length:513 start_codon:yes stop_codon:yes gene_type:complete
LWGIGALLLVLSGVPGIGIPAALAGYILILFAIKNISKILEDKSIFNNMLIVSITGIAGVISMAISFLILLMRLETDVNERLVVLLSMMLPVVIGLLLFWILFIISAIYMRKSYNSMGKRLNVNMFITSKINLIGSISSIILIGFLLFFIAQVLQIVAFFSIPDEIPEPQ